MVAEDEWRRNALAPSFSSLSKVSLLDIEVHDDWTTVGGSEGDTSSFPLSLFTDADVERVASRLGRTLSLAGVTGITVVASGLL